MASDSDRCMELQIAILAEARKRWRGVDRLLPSLTLCLTGETIVYAAIVRWPDRTTKRVEKNASADAHTGDAVASMRKALETLALDFVPGFTLHSQT